MDPVRIGVFGGTFNPIHQGHLHVARGVQRWFGLSMIHLVVAFRPPHKQPGDMIPFLHRYAMVCLAIAGERAFMPSLVELEPQVSSYSIDTMRKLARSAAFKDSIPYFIAGGDSLTEVHGWKDSWRLLTSYNFIFVVRPGTGVKEAVQRLPLSLQKRVRDLTDLTPVSARRCIASEPAGTKRIFLVDVGAPDISSSAIRKRVMSGASVGRMVPAPVGEYMRKLHLYGDR